MSNFNINDFIATFSASPVAKFINHKPWEITHNANMLVQELISMLTQADGYEIENNIAVHKTTVIETGATLKGPLIIGPRCFIANSAYIRGGNWLEADCLCGPGVELKSSFIFAGTKIAHFNFVGDSILGRSINMEAGSIIANYRNERKNKEICIRYQDKMLNTGTEKFGALIGDDCRIGANAVIAPGSLLSSNTVLGRLELFDQDI
jgi:NDP-sugar pyrophosphorylase family protein